MIELRCISKVYSTGEIKVTALKDVNLSIGEGEFVAIMGPSGSGKSTLLNILGCLDRPTNGSYKIDSNEVATLSSLQLATIRNKQIGFVFQSFNLLPRMSALDNVVLPLVYANVSSKECVARAKRALEKVGLADRMHHQPNELSGGQRQRVAIARALVSNPAVILADEPTGNLDSKSSEEIIKLICGLNSEGSTIVMVTHERDIAEHARRIVTFKDGEITSDEKVSA